MIVTYSGKYVDYHNIKKEDFDILDISMSLSKLNRFVGHSKRPYSVAEHTLHGLYIAKKMGYTKLEQLHWLIHDFTEAYVGDCPSPLKALLPEYQKIEQTVADGIIQFVGIKPLTEEEQYLVHCIDRTMLLIEMRDLTHHDHYLYLDDVKVFHDMLGEVNLSEWDGWQAEDVAQGIRDSFNFLMEELGLDV